MAKRSSVNTPPVPLTYEQEYQRDLAAFRKNGANYPIPEANHNLRVGDLITLGGDDTAQVEDLLDDGKIVALNILTRKGVAQDRAPVFRWWMDVEPLAPMQPTKFARPRLRTQYMQSSMRSLIHTCYSRGLEDNPDYQRDYVWTLEDKQRLIHSIFNRMDIGKFVFLSYWNKEALEVVDGKQRLRAILDFREGRFRFEGMTWNQLSWEDKRSFEDLPLQICEMDARMVTKADILWLFLAINSGGVPQTPKLVKRAQALYEQELGKGTIE